MMGSSPIPITLLTGFLGSGKTTLLSRLLTDPALANSAVIVNEVGAIGLDHHLLHPVNGDTLLMQGGCICCSMRDGLSATLDRLLGDAERNRLPIQRVIIETTGLADPGPILSTLMSDVRLAARVVPATIVTTVDALHGEHQLNSYLEAVRQVGVAERLVLTKQDLVSSDVAKRLSERLARINPGAVQTSAIAGEAPASVLIANPANQSCRWGHTWDTPCDLTCAHAGHQHASHDTRIRSEVFTFDDPMDWAVVADWLGRVAFFHGQQLLRMKGLLSLKGEVGALILNCIHQFLHEPIALRDWPDAERSSRVVFVTCDLEREVIEAHLRCAMQVLDIATTAME